jgi:phosphatidylethanolamine-binding protein (PEBP) family uncharacterized protein
MRASRGLGALTAAVVLLICGCGQGSTASIAPTIHLESPAVGADGVISPRVRCGAGTIWLPLKWGSPPSGTKELVLYFGWFKQGTETGGKGLLVPFGAVVREIRPSLRGIAANTLPEGSEYSYFTVNNCQPQRKGQSYLVELFALDHPQSAVPEPLTRRFVTGITEEALGTGRFAGGSAAETRLKEESLASSHLVATYGPKPE